MECVSQECVSKKCVLQGCVSQERFSLEHISLDLFLPKFHHQRHRGVLPRLKHWKSGVKPLITHSLHIHTVPGTRRQWVVQFKGSITIYITVIPKYRSVHDITRSVLCTKTLQEWWRCFLHSLRTIMPLTVTFYVFPVFFMVANGME